MKISLRLRILGACAVFLQMLMLVVAGGEQARIVAIGDVHGAYVEFSGILRRAGLIGETNQWIGETAILVQTGDILDRGPQVRECLDLLIKLQAQADKSQGKVIPLLGNHEVMNLMGDLRYVHPDEYRGFADAQSEETRQRAYEDYQKFLSSHRNHAHSAAAGDPSARHKWMDEHPPGYIEYRNALGSTGEYGRWLRKNHAVVQVGDGLFVHGGINPREKFRDIADLDEQIRFELANFDSIWEALSYKRIIWRYMRLEEALHQIVEELNWIRSEGMVENPTTVQQMQKLMGVESWTAASPDGPLWYRGLALEPEEELAGDFTKMMAHLRVKYLVAGHTPGAKGDIIVRFNQRVFLIDTGMQKEAYAGRASALEIQGGRITALYAGGEAQVLVTPGGGDNPAANLNKRPGAWSGDE